MIQLVFIISLPRSGSTLLQKMLTTNEKVSSSAEPWLLLPFWGMRNKYAARNVYSHITGVNALNDFIDSIPDGESVFNAAIKDFAMKIYSKAANGHPIFIDKTPRYYLMIPMLHKIFPEAKFIYLTRNPLSVISSICETFKKGRFLYYDYYIDWFEGHRLMADAIRKGGENTKVISYEKLILEPDKVMSNLCLWLNIEYSLKMLESYQSSKFSGRMGDPTGVKNYASVTSESLNKWSTFFDSKYKRRVISNLLLKLSENDLMVLGYSRSDLISSLKTVPTAHRGVDFIGRFWSFVNYFAYKFDYSYFQARFRSLKANKRFGYGSFRIQKK